MNEYPPLPETDYVLCRFVSGYESEYISHFPAWDDDALRAYVDADRAQQPPDASWRFAIDQARIVNCLDCTTSADDPVKSLAELIQWEVQTALDPSVSPAAQALIDQGLRRSQSAPEHKPMTAEQIFASDEIMAINAEAQIPLWLIVRFIRAAEAFHGKKETP